jgi:hypothetical protein
MLAHGRAGTPNRNPCLVRRNEHEGSTDFALGSRDARRRLWRQHQGAGGSRRARSARARATAAAPAARPRGGHSRTGAPAGRRSDRRGRLRSRALGSRRRHGGRARCGRAHAGNGPRLRRSIGAEHTGFVRGEAPRELRGDLSHRLSRVRVLGSFRSSGMPPRAGRAVSAREHHRRACEGRALGQILRLPHVALTTGRRDGPSDWRSRDELLRAHER